LPAASGPPDLVDKGFRVPRLMLVTDVRRARIPLLDLVTEATAGGVDAIYLRDAGGSIDDLPLTTRTLRVQIGDAVTLLVNGGPQAALATRTGLHLRERDMTPAAARRTRSDSADWAISSYAGRSGRLDGSRLRARWPCLLIAKQAGLGAARPGGTCPDRRRRPLPGDRHRRHHA